jgi:propanediol dehydratase large subunit
MTNREVIDFYKNKASHYDLSDKFVKKYQQSSEEYIKYAKGLGIKVDKPLAEPNQKWHNIIEAEQEAEKLVMITNVQKHIEKSRN